MKTLRTTLFIILIFPLSLSIHAQESNQKEVRLDAIENRIGILEGQKSNLDKQAELLKEDFEVKSRNLDAQFSESKNEIDKDVSQLRLVLYSLGIAGIIGLSAAVLYMVRYIKIKAYEIAEKKIYEHLSTFVEDKKEELVALINAQNLENRVKEKRKILVISGQEGFQNHLEQFFEKTGFKNVEIESSGTFSQPDKDIDLIIFNDYLKSKKGDHSLFVEYMEKTHNSNTNFIFLGDRFDGVRDSRINFANSLFTFYSQIINSLKYKELME